MYYLYKNTVKQKRKQRTRTSLSMAEEKDVEVVIVGAGPAGLAISACLNRISISNTLLEREECFGSLWKKRSYERLKLHLAKNYCELPHMSFPPNTPTFPSKACFIKYLEDYVFYFGIKPYYLRRVESASYDGDRGRWRLTVRNSLSNDVEVYVGRFLVVATGENGEGNVPYVPGLDRFSGLTMHSSEYKNGRMFESKNALVVGCGNSGMEIAYDLSNSGASTSIVVRSPVHVLDKEIVRLGMFLLRFLPCKVVDAISVKLFELKHGDVSKYGLKRPKNGPFLLKSITGRSPTIDVGCVENIKKGKIKVMRSIASINGEKVEFNDGKSECFDVIVFATGYKSSVRSWLEGGEEMLNENGMPKRRWPDHWKGENGLYCVGFGSKGLMGISADAQNVAEDIASFYRGVN